ncbi:MAG: homoserine dehydrogenase [Candidatus Omnitrophica bacterium]|nr:homoserine dehydrogenase [Candidatus Omnitrophota bacterium]
MIVKKIGIIGLGNVGEETVRSLRKHSSLITQRTSLKIEIRGLCDKKKEKSKIASKFSLPFTSSAFELINDPQIDIIVELMGGITPARTFIIEALKKGKNVVTANKALLAEYGEDIFAVAKEKGKVVGFEASVCGAIPLIKSISAGLVSCEIKKLYGILNGTTNYILYKMGKEKIDFFSALREAQNKGLAEKRPFLDIEGIDSLHKLCILSYLCFGVWPSHKSVYTEGISKISLLDIFYTQELNYRIKLLAIAKKEKNILDLRVHPTLIPVGHPLAETPSIYNAVYLDTHPAGELLFYGEGAGGISTSSSVISDIVGIALNSFTPPFYQGSQVYSVNEKGALKRKQEIVFQSIKDVKTRYYIRFIAQDEPGVLTKVSKILASLNISIASVTQKERKKGKFVPIVMITHQAGEGNIRRALCKIDKLSVIKSPSQVIRIEDL